MTTTDLARKLYPGFAKEVDEHKPYATPEHGYQPIINHIGSPLIQVDQDDYQGDTWVLYGPKRWGYLVVGWGSCSGCDALQACSTLEELEKLIHDITESVRWFDSKDDARKFFNDHDWQAEFSSFYADFWTFVNQARAALDLPPIARKEEP